MDMSAFDLDGAVGAIDSAADFDRTPLLSSPSPPPPTNSSPSSAAAGETTEEQDFSLSTLPHTGYMNFSERHVFWSLQTLFIFPSSGFLVINPLSLILKAWPSDSADTVLGLHFPTPTTASQVQGDPTLKKKAWHLDCMPFAFLAGIRPRDSRPVSLVRFGQKNLPSAHSTSLSLSLSFSIYIYIYIVGTDKSNDLDHSAK